MKMASVLDIDRVTSVIQRRCESLGVNVKWVKNAPTAMTNGKTITLPAVTAPVSAEAMTKLYGFVIHESGHHSRPDAFDILKALPSDTPEPLHSLFNIAEDDGMERQVAHTFRGDAIALGQQNDIILGEIAETWAKAEYPDKVTEQSVAPIAVCALGQLSRLEWDGVATASRAKFFNGLHPVTKGLVDKLVGEGWVQKLQATKTPDDTWDVACDLYKRLFPEADDDKIEELRDKGHSKQPAPADKGGEGTAGQDAKQTGASEDDDGAESAKHGDGKDKAKSKAKEREGEVIKWQDAVLSEHNEWQAKQDGETPGNLGIDWSDYTGGDVGLMPQGMVNVMDLRDKGYRVRRSTGRGSPDSFMPDNKSARAFGNQIRRYLQANARTRVYRDRYHGKLDKGSLVKLALPPIDGGEYNKKLFYDYRSRKQLNTAIHILTDWSGSMQGSKMVYAADASGRLVHVFDRVLRVPVQLAAFTNGRSKCDIGLIKRFSERSVSPIQIAQRFAKFHQFSSANNDADSVMWAYNQLAPRKEERKILIVLSDGCPAGQWAGSGHDNLQHVARSIEKEGKVELYGVGIKSDAVRNYYSNYKVLQDEHDINKTLFDIIKEGAYK
jgi:hypothetical protein